MIETGKIQKLTVTNSIPYGLRLSDGTEEVLLPNAYVTDDMDSGSIIEVFIYRDSEDRKVATTEFPTVLPGHFGLLEVVDVSGIGVFLDWGLKKDLLLPHSEKTSMLNIGQKLVVFVFVDEKSDRIIASARIRDFLGNDVESLDFGMKMEAMIYENNEFGSLVILDGYFAGMIHHNEFTIPPKIGSNHTVWLKRIGEDGRIDVSLSPSGIEGRKLAKDTIMDAFDQFGDEGGTFLHYHDKSDPEDIRSIFGMSKKNFKQRIGNLQKQGQIQIEKNGIRKL